MSAVDGRVCAIVVTHNRPTLLRACLHALRGQTRAVDAVLVVDNASTDGTRALLRAEFPWVTILALARNVGGAGGFHAGLKWAYGGGYDWLWIMDDDARPAPDCLEKLWAQRHPISVLVPVQEHSRGFRYGIGVWRDGNVEVTRQVTAGGQPASGDFVFMFVGPLIARTVVEQIGLPRADFFIWFDDIEYALRIHRLPGARIVVVPDAVIFHNFVKEYREVRFLGRRSVRSVIPPWKMYYGVRNHFYSLLRTRRRWREVLPLILTQLRALLGDVIYERDRWERVRLRLCGLRDGAIGRLGKRV